MQKKAVLIMLICLGALRCASAPSPSAIARCDALASAYQTCHQGLSFDAKSGWVQLSPHTSRVPCDDGRQLSFFERLEDPDFGSQMLIPYQAGSVVLPNPVKDADPGRIRLDPFFMSVYGGSADEVRKNLVNVSFLNQTVKFNSKNGAASALSAVGVDLEREAHKDSGLRKYLVPWTSGKEDLKSMTFYWRRVAATKRLSNHSFGAAIDLNDPNPKGPVYWLWDLAHTRQRRIQETTGKRVPISDILKTIREDQTDDFKPHALSPVPQKLIEIFERHGFIWGGKWYHFDAMHFEYRPEFFPNLKQVCLVPDVEDPRQPAEAQSVRKTQWMERFHWD